MATQMKRRTIQPRDKMLEDLEYVLTAVERLVERGIDPSVSSQADEIMALLLDAQTCLVAVVRMWKYC